MSRISHRAARLLAIAHETARRGDKQLGSQIFLIAAEEEPAPVADPEVIKAKIAKAIQDNDLDGAQAAMDELKSAQAANGDEDLDGNPQAGGTETDVTQADAEEEEVEEVPAPQVAKLVALAKKIEKAGHPDLAKRVTAALAKVKIV